MRVRSGRSAVASTVWALLLIAGCDTAADDDVPPAEVVDGDAATEDGPAVADGPSGSLRLTGWVERNRNMVSVALRGVAVDEAGHLLLDIEAVNRGFRGVSAASIASRPIRVTDDLGNRYEFVRPDGNSQLRFVSDERLTATLVFEGPIDPDARHLEVAFNQRDGESVPTAEDRPTQYPRFLFTDVPLPGVGLEDEADRGGSDSLIEDTTVEVDRTAEVAYLPDLEVTVVSYRTDGQVVEFEIEVVNGTGGNVELASGHPRLSDGSDAQFVFEPNESDDRDTRVIRLEPGDEASATVAFRGSISADAAGLRLRFNPNNRDRDSSSSPFVEFADLPLPDDGAAS